MIGKSVLILATLMSAASANAAVYVFTASDFNGPTEGPFAANTVETWNVALPNGQQIVSASFASSFGNSTVDSSSAIGFVTVGGVTVGSCASELDACFLVGAPISYDFLESEFGSLVGSVDLIYTQTGPFVIRLGESTLTVVTDGVPEPQSWAMMIAGFGLVGAAMRRRARAIAA